MDIIIGFAFDINHSRPIHCGHGVCIGDGTRGLIAVAKDTLRCSKHVLWHYQMLPLYYMSAGVPMVAFVVVIKGAHPCLD